MFKINKIIMILHTLFKIQSRKVYLHQNTIFCIRNLIIKILLQAKTSFTK